jgi:molybdenum ABC transporter molybdate-binding protein
MFSARGVILGSLGAIGLLIALMVWNQSPPSNPSGSPASRPLVVFCAAGIRGPVETIARQYEHEYGTPIQLQFGGSGTLLNNLRVAQRGDLFIAADSSFVSLALSNNLVNEVLPLARMTAVIGVPRGNPRQITGIPSLLQSNLRVALPNPDATASGSLTRSALSEAGTWDSLATRALVFKPTVTDVANDIKLGSVDAGIVWDATVRQYPELEAVSAAELVPHPSHVAVCILRSCDQPTQALRFARYLAARDRGLPVFAKAGFTPVTGDVWQPTPSVLLYSGTVNRVAIEESLREFELREGVQVTRVYNGCGILTAQIRAGQKPDAYFACDVSFMETVQSGFEPAVALAETDLVLLVQKGNPARISSLADLARPGLKVGLCHEQQSALGALTARLLRNVALHDSVTPNVSVQSPTGDLLVNQLRSGALDVAVVYAVNASQVLDHLDVISVSAPGTIAVQPYAVGLQSDHAQLMSRLYEKLRAQSSRDRFLKAGFRWKVPDAR